MRRLVGWLKRRKKAAAWSAILLALLFAWARWGPMDPLFTHARSTVVLARDGSLLGASVAPDGQWRFPAADSVPMKFATCLLQFEDRHFHDHWGVRPQSLVRAFLQNRRAGRTVSGGSTLTMQLARMSRGGQKRTYTAKAIECLLAWRIETRMDKEAILSQYAANAPFGGNVVGLEAAAWRWYGRAPHQLSWSASATLAVLPNAPADIYPGKGQEALRAKRDRLLDRMLAIGIIDATECALGKEEPLPGKPLPLPRSAPHLLTTLIQEGKAGRINRSTVDAPLQERAVEACERYAPRLTANEVHNAAALIVHVPSGEVRAYIGNLASASSDHAGQVDIIRAQRSTGSLLKPFLYADMIQSGEQLPDALVADIPTSYEGFAPRNFDEQYQGAVPASEALARSLNVPAVRALRTHGVDRTLRTLRAAGFKSINGTADHYGLSLIVGGAESSLWEIAGAYASMARVLGNYGRGGRTYRPGDVHPLHVVDISPTPVDTAGMGTPPLSASSLYATLTALRTVRRPDDEAGWRSFAEQDHIAWKTGTSYGHRDAWAVGVNEQWCVAVWTGNASGEGRPGLTGTLAAAPLMFDLFHLLPRSRGFDPPYDEMARLPVCPSSGHLASHECPAADTLWVPTPGTRTRVCPFHRSVVVEAQPAFRVSGGEGMPRAWFSLPPAMERYYAATHPDYKPLPPERGGERSDAITMEVLYPERGARLLIPIELDGTRGKAVVELAHRDASAQVHWDLDGVFIGTTVRDHRMAIDPSEGVHTLTFTDEEGRLLRHSFAVVSTRER